jgi:hypothetical protein
MAPPASGGLVLGYGRLHESAIEAAVAELAEVIRAEVPATRKLAAARV